MCEIIINQDLDEAIRYTPEMTLFTAPMLINGKIMGINLMLGKKLLGSFDTAREAVEVMSAILNCTERVFIVPGFEDYDGETEFWELMDECILNGWCNCE